MTKKILKVWKHCNDEIPDMGVDIYGRVVGSKPKEAPFNYVVSFERDGELYTMVFVAQDELDAVKQFLNEE